MTNNQAFGFLRVWKVREFEKAQEECSHEWAEEAMRLKNMDKILPLDFPIDISSGVILTHCIKRPDVISLSGLQHGVLHELRFSEDDPTAGGYAISGGILKGNGRIRTIRKMACDFFFQFIEKDMVRTIQEVPCDSALQFFEMHTLSEKKENLVWQVVISGYSRVVTLAELGN